MLSGIYFQLSLAPAFTPLKPLSISQLGRAHFFVLLIPHFPFTIHAFMWSVEAIWCWHKTFCALFVFVFSLSLSKSACKGRVYYRHILYIVYTEYRQCICVRRDPASLKPSKTTSQNPFLHVQHILCRARIQHTARVRITFGQRNTPAPGTRGARNCTDANEPHAKHRHEKHAGARERITLLFCGTNEYPNKYVCRCSLARTRMRVCVYIFCSPRCARCSHVAACLYVCSAM